MEENNKQKWAYSYNEEGPWSVADSKFDAICEAFDAYGHDHEEFYFGEARICSALSEYDFDELIIEHALNSDDYNWDGGFECLEFSKEQEKDLNDMVKKAVAAWEKKHSIKYNNFFIDDWEVITRAEAIKLGWKE